MQMNYLQFYCPSSLYPKQFSISQNHRGVAGLKNRRQRSLNVLNVLSFIMSSMFNSDCKRRSCKDLNYYYFFLK